MTYLKTLLLVFAALSFASLRAEVYVPITAVSDIAPGDEVIIAIQNGKSKSVWYALNNKTSGPGDVTRIYLSGNNIVTSDPTLIWTIGGTAGKYTFTCGAVTLQNTTWTLSYLTASQAFKLVDVNKQTFGWISTTNSDYLGFPADSILMDQISKGVTLRSGAYALRLFKKVYVAIFDPGEYGSITDTIAIADKNSGKVLLPSLVYNVHHPFLGWSTDPEAKRADAGKDGSYYKLTADTRLYAVYDTLEVSDQCFDFTDIHNTTIAVCGVDGGRDQRGGACHGHREEFTTIGIMDNGPHSIWSHHTVNTDTTEYDCRAGGTLRVIPPGYEKSVRLGNWFQQDSGEFIKYACIVDSTINPILLIRYAAIMQQPGHGSQNPRFTLEILDDKDQAIDPFCASFDFLSGMTTTGGEWKTFGPISTACEPITHYSGCSFADGMSREGGLWKDWTTLGVDLTPWHGRRVTIKFRTQDCEISGHWAYAYYTLECLPKRISVSSCGGQLDSTTLTVNEGFFYRWYRVPGQYLGYDRTLTVSNMDADTIYYCDLGTDKDFNCMFTLWAKVETRFPVADFDYLVHRGVCADTIYLWNTSFASPDGKVEFDPHQDCDGARWTVDGKLFSEEYEPTKGIVISEPGEHEIKLATYLTSWDCSVDSTSQKIKVEAGKKYQMLADTICQGDTFIFRNHALTRTGVYVDTITRTEDPNLCFDSVIIEEHLFVAPTFIEELVDSICASEVYRWHDMYLTASGNYEQRFLTALGCDSIYRLHLTYNPAQVHEVTEYDTICEGSVYIWHQNPYYKTGIYTDTLVSSAGCDSIVHLDLYVHPRYWIHPIPSDWYDPYMEQPSEQPTDTSTIPADWEDPYVSSQLITKADICEGDFYTWRDRVVSQAGFYIDTLYTEYGCDSVVYLRLFVHQQFDSTETHVIRKGETYLWREEEYTEEGTYYDSLYTNFGCDSIYELILLVNTDDEVTILDTICEGRTYFLTDDISYTKPGYYTDTLKKENGSDSIVHLQLFVLPNMEVTVDTVLCEGQSFRWGEYVWDKLTPDDSGSDFYVTYQSKLTGCDSVVTLNLKVCPTTYGDTAAWVCRTDLPYKWHSQSLTEAGQYVDTIVNQYGCDSVLTLTLNVIEPIRIERNSTICEGDSVFFYGAYYSVEGAHEKRLTSLVTGCDSIIVLNLKVIPKFEVQDNQSVCESDLPVVWHGKTYTRSGTYYERFTSYDGCDSIYILKLTVWSAFVQTTNAAVCSDELPFKWRGKEFNNSGYYEDRFMTAGGCDSVYKLSLTVLKAYHFETTDSICDGDVYVWRGKTLTKTHYQMQNEYHQTESFHTRAGCDSIYTLNLKINPSYMLKETGVICEGETFMWHGTPYYKQGIYTDSLKTNLGCDSIMNLELVVHGRIDPKYRKAPKK